MSGNYMRELAAWAEKKRAKEPRQDKHAVAFLAVRSDVQAALDAGYSMKTIWEHMRETGRLSSRYETFTLHVKRYIKGPQVQPAARAAPPVTIAAPARPAADTSAPKKPTSTSTPPAPPQAAQIGSFNFNPTPNKDDLL